MNLFLDDYTKEHYDLFTIYNFYDELNNKINCLINYCIKHSTDNKIFIQVLEISKLYKKLVMDNLDNNIE